MRGEMGEEREYLVSKLSLGSLRGDEGFEERVYINVLSRLIEGIEQNDEDKEIQVREFLKEWMKGIKEEGVMRGELEGIEEKGGERQYRFKLKKGEKERFLAIAVKNGKQRLIKKEKEKKYL